MMLEESGLWICSACKIDCLMGWGYTHLIISRRRDVVEIGDILKPRIGREG